MITNKFSAKVVAPLLALAVFSSACAVTPGAQPTPDGTPSTETLRPEDTPVSPPVSTPEPTAAPTVTPTATPTGTQLVTEPTPATSGAPPTGAPATGGVAAPPETTQPAPADTHNDAYFDSAVFVGDSVMEGLHLHVARRRKTEKSLGEAKFLTTTIGVSVADLVGDIKSGISYSYKGVEKPIADIVVEMGVNRIFLMLGLNDLSQVNPDIPKIIDRYSRLIDLLQTAVPGVDIIVMTNTPKTKTTWLPNYTANRDFGNALIDSFVTEVIAMCNSKGIAYIDINAALRDANGALPDEYSSDDFVHINDKGARVIVNALYGFAAGK
ncbi:MAG: GDSL-type esterase/lipase family protein [Oscillospiraceae bacterium]|jgi:lysophospholipase L1-like esterase|nr:GDSL-type esterase/lipase family protein [Oscillospiraceae bacterium]